MQNHLPLCPKNLHKHELLDRYSKILMGEATPEDEVGESDGSTVGIL